MDRLLLVREVKDVKDVITRSATLLRTVTSFTLTLALRASFRIAITEYPMKPVAVGHVR